MATPLAERFYLFEVIGGVNTYYYVDGGGAVQATTDEATGMVKVSDSPNDWKEVEMGYDRSESLHGIFTQVSNEYTFYGNAAKIIWHKRVKEGYAASLKLRIDVLEQTPASFYYETLSINDIDFSTFEGDHISAKVLLFEAGIGADLKTNLDTPYEIPLTGPDVVDTIHQGTTIKSKYNYRYGETVVGNAVIRNNPNEVFNLLIAPTVSEGLRPVAAEHTADGIRMGIFGSGFFYGAFDGFSDQYDRYILSAQQDIPDVLLNFKADFRWRFMAGASPGTGPATNCVFRIFAVKSFNRAPFIPEIIYSSATVPSAAAGVWYDESIDIIYSLGGLANGQRVYIVMGVYTDYGVATTASAWGFEIETVDPTLSRVSLDMNFDPEESQVQGYRWFTLWKKTIEKFADGKYGAMPAAPGYLGNASTFIKGNYPWRTILTNGLSLKGGTGTIFKVTPGDMIDDAEFTWGSGVVTTENQVFLKPLPEIYDRTTEILNIGQLTGWKLTPLNNVTSKIKIGNAFEQGDILNGLEDFNTQNTYKVQAIFKEENFTEYVSPFNASIYNIEKLRVQEFGKDTTGNKVNDDIYKYSVLGTPEGSNYPIRYPDTDYFVYGVDFPSRVYNVEFSPGNTYQRLKEIIASNTYPSLKPITFQTTERYAGMRSFFYDYDHAVYFPDVIEKDNLIPAPTTNPANRLWYPWILTGQSEKPFNIRQVMKNNPYGYVTMTIDKDGELITMKGFIRKVRFKPVSRSNFDWEFLLTPDNDMEKLI